MEAENMSKGLMQTNNNPRLQEDESSARPVKELVNVQVDPNESSHVIKIEEGQNKELDNSSRSSYATTKMCLNGRMQTW